MTQIVGRLGQVAAIGAATVAVSQGIKVAAQILSVAVLARLLTPEDFGTVALVSPIVALVAMFQDLGLQQAIVQRPDVLQDHLTRAFWFTALLGLVGSGIMAIVAPGVAAFYGDGRLILLTLATTPALIVASIASVPTALLNRGMRFRTLAMVDIGSTLATLAAAVVSAWLGAQYWSLIISTLSGNVVLLLGVWWSTGWRPGRPSLQLPDRGMLGFGANLTGFSFMSFLARNLDKVLIGRFAGSVPLGYYDRAYKLLLFPLANVNAPISRIAVPLLSRIQHDKPRFRDVFLQISSQVALLTIPGMAALVATSEETVNFVFGPNWHDIVPIFAWLGLAGLVQPMTFAVSWLLIAQGRTATMFRWGMYSSGTAAISFVIGLQWGAVGVACAYAVSDYVVRLPVLYIMVQRVGPATALDLIGIQVPLLAAAALTALISEKMLRGYYGLNGIYLIGTTILASYGLAVAIMVAQPRSRAILHDTFSLFWQLGRRVRSDPCPRFWHFRKAVFYMSSTTFGRSAVRISNEALRGPLLILVISILGFAVSRRVMTHLGQWSDTFSCVAVVVVFAVAVAFRSVRYSEMTAPLRITTRCIGIIVLIQVAFDAFGPFPGPPNILFGGEGSPLYFRYAAVLGVVAGIAGLWRPSFLAPLFLYYVGWRELIGTISGIHVVDTDYLGMIDVGYFGVLGVFVAICATSPWAIERFAFLRPLLLGSEDTAAIRARTYNLVWACAIGAHLGSYFWSGMTKIFVGGDNPLTWVLQNPTQTAIVIGLERGDNPLATWPTLLQSVWDGIIAGQPYLNIFVFGSQLLSPFAPLSAPILEAFCLLYDMFHIGVYFTLGALFFFWIAVNLVIVAATASLPRHGFTPAMKIVMALTTLFGHYFFYTNHLGWLDTAKLDSPQFYAITRDNREVEVPSNYFGIYSYTIAQAAMYIPDGHFPFKLAGNFLTTENWHDGLTCGPLVAGHQDTGVSLDAVKSMVIETDKMMRKYPAVKNDNIYYFYPHHMLPNPWVFTDFNNLKIDDIVGYNYVMESVCLTLNNGRLDRDVHKRSVFHIDLR